MSILPPGETILVLGAGPIVIGQGAEFDYSGVQACKALRARGYRVVLINSNPATIMTDADVADATYVEPLTLDFARQVIARERPQVLLPTVGGQTALNLALELHDAGVLTEFGVRLIGASPEAIVLAEDRERFKEAMLEIGVGVARSGVASDLAQAEALLEEVGLPAIIRPSFTLGGTGGGIAWNSDEFREIATNGLDLSPTHQILVEQSLLGWKEYELEVIRDLADNAIVVCSIENFDPMGVHTGDSITVAPAMTLTDREYQHLRDLALKIIRRVGVETGGSNVQFAVNPATGEVIVIELNPRVSRSSALASKATGYPIAKVAAQLAVGLTLDQIHNDITGTTPASFEPVLDYVIVKIPRWNFDKFASSDRTLGTVMRAVGEVMGIGRTFPEALLKAVASLEGGWPRCETWSDEEVKGHLAVPTPDRLAALLQALRRGTWTLAELQRRTHIDPWFLEQLQALVAREEALRAHTLESLDADTLREAKRAGLGDLRISYLLGVSELAVASRRAELGLHPVYKRVDSCAAEFDATTPYLYSTWEEECEAGESPTDRVVILGNGPNRIGQGLEFDHACCHAAYAVRALGLTSVMVNNNPETVSTDYDTSDKLYFEPIDGEHVQAILDRERPRGVILQFGGQTPLKLAHRVGPVLGTSPEAIDLCEDRERFAAFLARLGIPSPEGLTAYSAEEAYAVAGRLGFPLLVRPSYVLGGRSMVICYDEGDLRRAVHEALLASEARALLLDRYLMGAVEYDVDALCDGDEVLIGAITEHIEEAGVHSGDSAGVIPPVRLSPAHERVMRGYTERIAVALGVVGLVNIQYAIAQDTVYVLEVNPRASRTVPFVSKATGLPLAALATRLALGATLRELGPLPRHGQGLFFVKAPVFPWRKFPGASLLLGPEMRSTGEVMGVGWHFGAAYAKALIAAGLKLPTEGAVFLSMRDEDKEAAVGIAGALAHMGFALYATRGTCAHLARHGLACTLVYKVGEGRPHAVDLVKNGALHLILNTPLGKKSLYDEAAIHQAGLRHGVPCITNLPAAQAVVSAIRALRAGELKVLKLQEIR